MTSQRKINKRLLRWERYLTTISRSSAPVWCHVCNQHHPDAAVRVTPGYLKFIQWRSKNWFAKNGEGCGGA